MNIFITNSNPILSAQALDDKRVNKMLLETCQLLCAAINLSGGQAPYKTSHANHPSCIWARETRANWLWLFEHGIALGKEFTIRSGKMHKCYEVLSQIKDLDYLIPEGPLTTFPNCTTNKEKGISYKHITSTTEAYKHYLIARWNTDKLAVKWSNRGKPSWLGVDNQGKYCYIESND